MTEDVNDKVVYWHRELPPLDAELLHEHVLEATSARIAGSIERHGELWEESYDSLMAHATARLIQEVKRLGGHYAHVLDEHVDSRRDDVTGVSWLAGRFSYVLYRRQAHDLTPSRQISGASPTPLPSGGSSNRRTR